MALVTTWTLFIRSTAGSVTTTTATTEALALSQAQTERAKGNWVTVVRKTTG